MRLFDRLIACSSKEESLAFRMAANGCGVLLADQTAKMLFETGYEKSNPAAAPYARPPWRKFFVEWNVHDNDAGARLVGIQQIGLLGQCWSINTQEAIAHYESIGETGHGIKESTLLVKATPYISVCGIPTQLETDLWWTMTREGFVEFTTLSGELEKLKSLPETDQKTVMVSLYRWATVAWLSFSYLNCSGIATLDVTEREQPPAKIRRRLKLPEVRRYTLAVKPTACRRGAATSENDAESMTALHMCRGSFAVYTAERPLFGKYTGRFWRPAHVKGKKENGEVIKDYAIAAEAAP